MQPGAKLRVSRGHFFCSHTPARSGLRILRRTRSNAGRTSAGSLSGRIESIWKTPSKERGEAHGIACLESGLNTKRACNAAARSCPSSLSKFPGRTWTSGSVRGKHVTKFVQVPCPSSCSSSGFRRSEAHRIACLELGRNTERASNTAARSCPSSLSKFPGRTWTSGSARGKHVIKLVQVPCPSSCPSSGFRPGPRSWNRACLESGRCSETYTTLFNNKTTRRRKY